MFSLCSLYIQLIRAHDWLAPYLDQVNLAYLAGYSGNLALSLRQIAIRLQSRGRR